MPSRPPLNLLLRRPTPADYAGITTRLDDWWGRRQAPGILSRLWFEHFAGTSWIAHALDGELAGYLVGFLSPGHPADFVIVSAAVAPGLRRHGVGRRLHEGAAADALEHGAARLVEPAWPGDPVATAFLRAAGFVPEGLPGTRRLYGVPAYPDQEWGREDRAIFVRELAAGD